MVCQHSLHVLINTLYPFATETVTAAAAHAAEHNLISVSYFVDLRLKTFPIDTVECPASTSRHSEVTLACLS
jgi:hypothetical protein